MSSSLRERLAQLQRAPQAGPVAKDQSRPDLDRLERRLLGASGEELPLKDRLQRLVALAASGRGAWPSPELERPRSGLDPGAPAAETSFPPSRDSLLARRNSWTGRSQDAEFRPDAPGRLVRVGPRLDIEELVQGLRVANGRGEFFLMESAVHLESSHGAIPLSRFRSLAPDSVAVLSGEPGLNGFRLHEAVFLDTETTGLAGGTGTAAFLVGLGWVDGERFHVRQFFMRDYHEEAALLHGLAAELSRFRSMVTFNGRLFDVPLLESRYRLCREPFPLDATQHLDLLQPARRLWKARIESCRLQTLERELLGFERQGDVPGAAIPSLYFDYVRQRDARALARVFEHNRLDIVSLAALAVYACQWVEQAGAEDPRDVLSLARVLERARLLERSDAQYRRALAGTADVRVPALLWLAARAKRSGDHAAALALWEEAAGAGDAHALRELAMHHEHRGRAYAAALEIVERGLSWPARGELSRGRRFVRDFERRRERLRAKLARFS